MFSYVDIYFPVYIYTHVRIDLLESLMLLFGGRMESILLNLQSGSSINMNSYRVNVSVAKSAVSADTGVCVNFHSSFSKDTDNLEGAPKQGRYQDSQVEVTSHENSA